eukprot:5983140-Amphidinium_carterae.1
MEGEADVDGDVGSLELVAPEDEPDPLEGVSTPLEPPEAMHMMASTPVDAATTEVSELPEVPEVVFAKAKAKTRSAPMFFAGLRTEASATVVVGDSGRISYYFNKGVFEAYCKQRPQCKLTHTGSSSSRANGRPLGVLSGWLGFQCTAQQHKDRAFLQTSLTHELRRMSRHHL